MVQLVPSDLSHDSSRGAKELFVGIRCACSIAAVVLSFCNVGYVCLRFVHVIGPWAKRGLRYFSIVRGGKGLGFRFYGLWGECSRGQNSSRWHASGNWFETGWGSPKNRDGGSWCEREYGGRERDVEPRERTIHACRGREVIRGRPRRCEGDIGKRCRWQ